MNRIKPLPLSYRVTSGEIKEALYEYFREKNIHGFAGANFTIKKKDERIEVSAQLALEINSRLIDIEESAKLTTIEIEDPYKISDELKGLISPFIKPNQSVSTKIISFKQGRGQVRKKFIIELDPIKTLWYILDTPPEGFQYVVTGAVSQKNNSQLLLALKKKIQKKNKNKK